MLRELLKKLRTSMRRPAGPAREEEENGPEPGRGSLTTRFSLTGLVAAGAAVAIFCTVAGFAGGLWWLFDLCSHLRVQYAAFLLVAAGILLARRNWRPGGAAAFFAVVNFAVIAPMYFGPATGATGATGAGPFRAVAFNVNRSNPRHGEVLDWIRRTRPDFIVILELSGSWSFALRELRDEYPYSIGRAREDSFGIGLWSRRPLRDAEIVILGPAGVPSISARIDLDGRELRLLATHPLPPAGSRYARLRNAHLADAAGHVASVARPVMLIGDLNVKPWSPHFSRLVRESGLRDARRGFGVGATWPSGPLFFLGIPLDHCLVSDGIRVLGFAVGPSLGSDHSPITVDFALPASPGAGR